MSCYYYFHFPLGKHLSLLLHESHVCEGAPNAKGAERPKKEADKSSLSVDELNREPPESQSWAAAEHAQLCVFRPQATHSYHNLEMNLHASTRICGAQGE